MAVEASKRHCELSTITDEVPVTLRRLRRVRDRSVISAVRVDPADRVVHLASRAARGESPASHRGRRCARLARRDEREYREYLNEEQRSQTGCSAGRMQLEFHHGLLRLRRAAVK